MLKYDIFFYMGKAPNLKEIEHFYMALADKTRLRLLNLMSENEVCVCFFTEVLGESQPKISRHLAYLRNAGLVKARRDGKWMHYSIVWPKDDEAGSVLRASLDWLASLDDMQLDTSNYEKVCCTPELLVQIARTPIDFIDQPTLAAAKDESEDAPTLPTISRERHNELEEFLL